MPALTRPARRYLVHAALLTSGLAIGELFYNLLLVELGYHRRGMVLPVLGETPLLGILNSLPVLAAALSSLPIWLAVGRIDLRLALAASAVLHAVALLGVALRPDPLPLFLCAALSGVASVLFQVSAAPFMMDHSGPDERDALFALSSALMIGAASLSFMMGGLLLGSLTVVLNMPSAGAWTYRLMFGLAALLAALAALPMLSIPARPSPVARSAVSSLSGIGVHLRFMRDATFHALRFIVAPFLISLGAALLIPFLNLYFRQRYAASDAALGMIFAAMGIATALATLLAPILARRFGRIGSVILTQSLAIPCLLVMGTTPWLWLAVVVALVRNALMNMSTPLYEAYTMEHTPPAARPFVIGLMQGAFSVGSIIGPPISATVQQQYGFGPLFIATACFYASAVVATILLFLRPRQRTTK